MQVPAEEEAGCLGAALQAMVVYDQQAGVPASFPSTCDRCVRLNESATAWPRAALRAAYDQARQRYRSCLLKAYPQLAA